MKTLKINVTAGIFTAILLMFASCEKNTADASDLFAPFLFSSADGISVINEENMLNSLGLTPGLSTEELSLLIAMRDEEKLARDVYSALSGKWNHPVFSRISAAEQTHMSAVNRLLKYYNAADTTISDPGKFDNTDVQKLYDELVAKGSATMEEAFRAGALIEEMDIKDLRDAVSKTSNENIIMVLGNLERGSRNHLRAFNRQLSVRQQSYTPVYLTPDEYESIVNSPVEAGNHYKMNHNGRKRKGRW